jgi:hypothetical protein
MTSFISCYDVNNQIICVDDFAKNVINLTKREYRTLTVCEYDKLLEELRQQNAKELKVTIIEKHRFDIRVYYRIYRVSLGNYRYKYFMEVFDGSSATYEYVFCFSKKRCLQMMEERERKHDVVLR